MADAKQPGEQYEMPERNTQQDEGYNTYDPSRDEEQDEANFGGTAQEEDVLEDEEYVEEEDDNTNMNMSDADIQRTQIKINMERWKRLREVFHKIFRVPIRKTDNDKLFENTVVRTKKSGHQELWYKGKRIFFKKKGEKLNGQHTRTKK